MRVRTRPTRQATVAVAGLAAGAEQGEALLGGGGEQRLDRSVELGALGHRPVEGVALGVVVLGELGAAAERPALEE